MATPNAPRAASLDGARVGRTGSSEASIAFRRARIGALLGSLCLSSACSHDRPRAPPPAPAPQREAAARTAEVETPRQIETVTSSNPPYRANVGRGAELYLPPWFTPKHGGYDLVVHFHGVGRWQEANLDHARLNAAVVSVNLGAGTDPYANAFRTAESFDRLLAETQAEIGKSGRAESAQLRRLALSAWSAGFSSVARVTTEAIIQRVDAILLADGFFTFFSEPKKRAVNAAGLEKFARYAEAARKDEKLFMITHTTIPTGPYPSVQECVAKLLEMLDLTKTPAVAIGPRNMHQFYVVDKGSFHIRGYEGTQAADHVKQLHAMGETEYPLLKARWEKQDETATETRAPAKPPATPIPAPARSSP